MHKFIKSELKSDSDLEKTQAKIDNELELGSDNDSVYDAVHWFFNFLHGWLQIKNDNYK